MSWKPMYVRADTYVSGRALGREGYALVNLRTLQVDYRYIFPVKSHAYSECQRRNGRPKELLAKMENNNENL